MRVVMPTVDDRGEDSRVTGHMGMAPYITVVDADEGGNLRVRHIRNESAEAVRRAHAESARIGVHVPGHGHIIDLILSLRPDALITHAIGPGAFYAIREAGVRIFRPKGRTVRESVEALLRGELEELEAPTEDHGHEGGHGGGRGAGLGWGRGWRRRRYLGDEEL